MASSIPIPIYRERSHPLINRHVKGSSFLSKLIFVLSRAADIPLQYQILGNGLGTSLIHALGGQTLIPYPIAATQTTFIPSVLGLSPYRTVLLGMSVTTMLKQVNSAIRISQENMSPLQALSAGLVNMVANSMNTLAFTAAGMSVIAVPSEEWDLTSPELLVGSALFVLGIAVEWWSEEQRKTFKDDLRNRGKVYSGGLFSLARHINYGGFMLWRTGFAVASGGWLFGAVAAAVNFATFEFGAVPELDEYCRLKYTAQWTEYRRRVPYKLIPYVW